MEMKDYVVVVEGPQNDERAIAVIAEVKKLVPNKPIKYVVNSHHHFDHAGGLGPFVAEGATIITHAINKPFFEQALAAPRTVSPDKLAQSGKKATIETLTDKLVLRDDTRTLEIHHIKDNLHHDGLIMVYLPKEKLLIEADAYTPAAADAPPPAQANPYSVNLHDNIGGLKLEVDRILPLHGRIVPLSRAIEGDRQKLLASLGAHDSGTPVSAAPCSLHPPLTRKGEGGNTAAVKKAPPGPSRYILTWTHYWSRQIDSCTRERWSAAGEIFSSDKVGTLNRLGQR